MTNAWRVSDVMQLWQAILIAMTIWALGQAGRWKWHERRIDRHQAKLDARLAAGEDRYFEELRELEAYDPRQNPPWKNVMSELLGMAIWFALAVYGLMQMGM